MVVCPLCYSGINCLSRLDKVKLAAMTLLMALTLLLSTVSVEGFKAPVHQSDTEQALVVHAASHSDDGVVKFVGSNQNHLLRLEHSLRSDNAPQNVVYELITSWSQQAILLLLCGLLLYAALFYPKQSFRDNFATIHSRRLQRRHLQYRFSQSFLA
ncbi:hypothetical protein ACW5XF_05765 [Aeromonas lusitana]|uniref:Uncharacterized protein n=1 Tax=Aeromonas lusitana TaxID=931529 RepID=A0A2M8H9V7_9GAMM|nr:hypothetical protein [Aeromonas lusitana]PJC93310.1 hypothetical protein CUC44_10230 [Aeromonas lusitana]